MRTRSLMLSVLLVVLVPSTALADDAATKAAFEAADYDGNGKVTYEEFRNRALMVFPHLDTNDDGRISASEHQAIRGGDGGTRQGDDVTVDQYNVALRSYFDEVDTDKDGALDLREWSGGDKAREEKP